MFSQFDRFPWDFRENFFSRFALLVTLNAHTKFHQNRLIGQISMELRTTSFIEKLNGSRLKSKVQKLT